MRILDRHTHDPYHNQNQVWQEDTPDIVNDNVWALPKTLNIFYYVLIKLYFN